MHLSVASDDPVSKLLEVRQQGAAVWATLDAQSVPLFRDIFNRMEGHGKSVLEIGSGYGFTSILFALLGAKAVHGMDVVAPAIERAKRIKEQLDPRLPVFFYRCDAAKPFPFQHDVFDIVLAIEVLSHIVTDDLTGLLGEVVRVLRPGGLVYLSDGNNARSWRKRHENYRIWRRFELGPPTQAAETVYTHRIAKPYVEIRRDIAKEAEPSLSEETATNIASRTFQFDATQVRDAVRQFVRSGALPNSPFRHRVCPVEPLTRTFIEQLVDPRLVRRSLRRLGCEEIWCGPRRKLPLAVLWSKLPWLTFWVSNGFVVIAKKKCS